MGRGSGSTPTNTPDVPQTPPAKNQPPPPAPSSPGPTTRPSQSGGTGDGGASSSTTSTSGTTPNTAITPEVTVQVGGGYYLGFQPISNTSWSSTTTNQVSCTGGNSGRAGGNLNVTSSTSSSSNTNLGCSVTVGRTWEDVENDRDYAFEVQADLIKSNPGVFAKFSMNF